MIPFQRSSVGFSTTVAAVLLAAISLFPCSGAWSDDRVQADNTASSPAAAGELEVQNTEHTNQPLTNPDVAEPRSQYLIGVQCSQADSFLRQHLKLGDRGLVVQDLIPGGPAAESGLHVGDLILSASKADLRTVEELMHVIQDSEGQTVELSILRSGETMTISVVPQKRSQQGHSSYESAPVRQFHPGIIINRNSPTEDAHQILEQALKAAGIESAWQLTPHHHSATPQPSSAHSAMLQEIATLREQIRLLTERVSTLERSQHAEVTEQQPQASGTDQ